MRFIQAGVMLTGGLALVGIIGWYYSISAWAAGEDHSLLAFFIPAGHSTSATEIFGPILQVLIPAFIAWNAALLIVTVLVLVDSVRKVRVGKTTELTQGVLIVKLAAILFFVCNFVPLALLAVDQAALFFFGGFIVLAAIAGAAVLTYLAMLSTSIYGWASVRSLRREQRITKAQAAIFSVLLCIFVLDVLAGILLHVEMRRTSRAIELPIVMNETT